VKGALAAYLEEALGRSKAPVEGGDGTAVAPELLLSRARAIAGELSARKIGPAEPVLATIFNRPADLAAMLGIWLAGGVVVPLHANAAVRTAEQIRSATGVRLRVDGEHIEQLAAAAPPARQLLREAALIVFTSGSTGKPKGVVIGHARLAGKLGVLGRLLNLGAEDSVIVPLHLTFIFGIWVSLLAVRSGARLVLMPRFTPDGLAFSPAARRWRRCRRCCGPWPAEGRKRRRCA
jgi:acyl-CoA synthetase (AMP-forming)/AMP-acid ligase II